MQTFSELYYSKPRGSTDKGTIHDYVNGYYTKEFTSDKRDQPLKILEIGINDGYSLILWKEWFTNSDVYAIDVRVFGVEGINCFFGDAYSPEMINKFENDFFDYIIDDGPHTIQSQVASVEFWVPKLKSGGKLIIEDIQNFDDTQLLIDKANEFNLPYKLFDLRQNIGRYDDVVFEVTKP